MPLDYLPSREADLLAWTNSFSSQITADPVVFGLDAIQATTLATLLSDFQATYDAATNNNTRTPAIIVAKRDAKNALIAKIRELAAIIQADPSVTDQQKSGLGLTVRDSEPTPVPVPKTRPGIQIFSSVGRSVTIKLSDVENPDSRGKPEGVDGATVLTFLGSTPPAPEDIPAWTFQGNTGRTSLTVNFDPSVESGTTAWFTAFWFNTRKQSGPATLPVSTQIPGSLPQAA